MTEVTPEEIAELRRLAEAATKGPWLVQDGCSWRRIGTSGHDGDVICPTNHWKDGHPDLQAKHVDLDLVVAMRNKLAGMLDALEAAADLRAVLIKVRDSFIVTEDFGEAVMNEAENHHFDLICETLGGAKR